ncbi:hypothetical protein [Amycolatopsis rubida]|uniref:Uncharacterized protein n=1 Tax=Amycolatopsis rubida TaxID=112413 RepID=A0A1I5X7N3_9PSEU|nr:hypothetical protein [Amycolatopsis rubida]SFQ28003.1 hypothetical protein SAMN05421854_11083 [Amycolatopsis rubida]
MDNTAPPNHPLGHVDHVMSPAGLSTVCDFCERDRKIAPARWYYPLGDTATVEIGGIPVAMDVSLLNGGGGYVTCDTCHGFIESGDYERLAKVAGYAELPEPFVWFRKRRVGPAQPL